MKFRYKKLFLTLHRDLGFFFAGIILIYSISGFMLNHRNDFDPDYVLERKDIKIEENLTKQDITKEKVIELSKSVGEEGKYKLYDFPTENQVKIYFKNAYLQVYMNDKHAIYEKVAERPGIYQMNMLHRAANGYWIILADIFVLSLIITTITGIFLVGKKYGVRGRGIWLASLGVILPIIFVILW